MRAFKVPPKKKLRVIINTDAKAESDDQYAIVHALLTPKFIIKGIISAHFSPARNNDTMEQSYAECQKVLSIMGMENDIPLVRGSKYATSKDEYEYSEGARLIVEEALKDDELPLFVVFMGPITDLACAYRKHPEIAERLTAIWIGGNAYPNGGWEFNLGNDIDAANTVFQSNIDLWQVPMNVYGSMNVSLTSLEMRVAPCGDIGQYLFEQMVDLNDFHKDKKDWPVGESWSLGDSPTVGLMINQYIGAFTMKEVPVVSKDMSYSFTGEGRHIRVYDSIDSHFILEDMYAKLTKHAGKTMVR